MTKISKKLISELKTKSNQSDAIFLQRFFKTRPGEYGEGDRFLGIRVPITREIAKQYIKDLEIVGLTELLQNKWHEVRLAALIIMQAQFKKASQDKQQDLYELYSNNIGKGINNWDLVDVSCPNIVGAYLYDKNRFPLYELAEGELWHKRVSIISTFYYLKCGEPGDTYNLAEKLVYEKHDLLQKAVGWSLREMGKLDNQLLEKFLTTFAATMPRTALRYSIEKLPPAQKNYFMNLKNEN